jgi:hypothetical protein
MKVKLISYEIGKGIAMQRDGVELCCPHQPDGAMCGNWCPACHIHQPLGNLRGHVELKCFPQPVDFEIENEKAP